MAESQSRVRPGQESRGIDWTFVGEAWAIATLLAIASTAVLGGLAIALLGLEDSVGAVYIAAIVATFLSYWAVVHRRLHAARGGQFVNAVSVGVLHFVVALVATIVTIAATGVSVSDIDGSEVGSAPEFMLVLFALERTGVVAILGSLLAFGTAGDTSEIDDVVV
jgi:hypothetical protein